MGYSESWTKDILGGRLRHALVQRLFASSSELGFMCRELLADGSQGDLNERESSKGFSGNRGSPPARG